MMALPADQAKGQTFQPLRDALRWDVHRSENEVEHHDQPNGP
jgi:hypothetical protein